MYYNWHLVMLLLECKYTKTKKYNHILKLILNLQHNLAKIVRQLHMGSLHKPCIWDDNICVSWTQLPHYMCFYKEQSHNPHHCIWVHELHIIVIWQLQHKFNYRMLIKIVQLTKNTSEIFHTLATFLKFMCNYSFSNMKFDIKKWSYFSHKVAI